MNDNSHTNNLNDENILPVTLESEMKKSYLDYAMSVIVSRALPDVRDGLKPVHRRILYAMKKGGYTHNRATKKSARIVGDVMGKYHPHGDSAIYDAMVRMAQDFSMRLPLVEGQGNYGNIDGSSAAAMRYTEARMALVAQELVADIDNDTVDFTPNYDETTIEPTVLPSAFPNLLVNGAGGIAVGMATNIPPHNLGELIDACCALVENPDTTVDELMEEHIFGPDFPTGGLILGRTGIRSAFNTGRGSVVVRGKAEVKEVAKDKFSIFVTQIPYQVNLSKLLETFQLLVKEKRVEGISNISDYSNSENGILIEISVKKDHQAEVVLNQLYQYSQLQTSFGVNCLALNENKPELLNIKQALQAFLKFRETVITRRLIYKLKTARKQAHNLAGLSVAVENIDEVINIIRGASSPAQAKEELLSRAWRAGAVEPMIALLNEPDRQVVDGLYKLSTAQVQAILDLRLQRLTGMERDKIIADLKVLTDEIKYYLDVLASREMLLDILVEELRVIKNKFATPRKTIISDIEYSKDIEELIAKEDMIITVTNTGYIKRVPLSTYNSQRRGGKGRKGMATNNEDIVSDVFVSSTHQPVLFFSSKGLVYRLKVYKLPAGSPTSKGKPMINLLPLSKDEKITTVMVLPEDIEEWKDKYLIFSTKSGSIRRNKLEDFESIRANGKIAMKLEQEDSLISVKMCTEEDDILISSKLGNAVRCPVTNVRVFASRNSSGVRGIRLSENDHVIGLSILYHSKLPSETRDSYLKQINQVRRKDEEDLDFNNVSITNEEFLELQQKEQIILSVSSQGYGKRTSSYEYRTTKRGGKGVSVMKMGDKNKELVASLTVNEKDDIVMVTSSGQIIRYPVNQVRIAGRSTQGVRLFNISKNEQVVSLSVIPYQEEDNEDQQEVITEDGEVITEITTE